MIKRTNAQAIPKDLPSKVERDPLVFALFHSPQRLLLKQSILQSMKDFT